MRRLGDKALTGAEKQKRHREKIKARLEEAAALKERCLAHDLAASGEIAGLSEYYAGLLREFGASAEEARALTATLDDVQGELALLLRARGQAALESLRARRKRSDASLLARLAGAGSMGKT